MNDFLSFRTMISTPIIKVIYVLGTVFLTVSGFAYLIQGEIKAVIGLGTMIFGNLFWRVVCEGWILIFSIHDILDSIAKNLKK